MFGKLKEKLKGWINKNKEDEETETSKTEKETVTTPTKKEKNTDKKTDKKTRKETKKEKTEKKEEKQEKKKSDEQKDVTKIKSHKKETHKEIIKEVAEEATKEAQDINNEQEKNVDNKKEETDTDNKEKKEIDANNEQEKEKTEKKGIFGLFKRKEHTDKPAKEETTKETEQESQKEETDTEVKEKKPEKRSLFRKTLTEEKFDELYEELSMILLQHNVAYEAVDAIKENLKEQLIGKTLSSVNLAEELENAIKKLLINPPNFIETIKEGLKEKKPYVILFSGINGSGKTTTIAKVTHYLKQKGFSVCLAAADTFRAASIEQIEQHAKKLNVELIKKDYGSDPASVGFDAINYAKKNNIDIVLIDTAGRMQNKDSLMKEIEKIVRVNKPDMKIFLGESITGNDATEQAKSFNETIGLTGIILSKADVDEKGGTAISVSHITGKPILFLGTGQEYENLEEFDKEKLIEKLGLT